MTHQPRSSPFRALFSAVLLCSSLLVSSSASAADGSNLQRLEPEAVPVGGFAAGSGETINGGNYTLGGYFQYIRNPLVYRVAADRESSSIQNTAVLHLNGSYGITDWFEISAGLPLVVYQNSTDPLFTVGSFAVSDLYVQPRFNLLSQWRDGIALSLGASVTAPLGGHTAFAGDKSVTVTPNVTLSHQWSKLYLGTELYGIVRRYTTDDASDVNDPKVKMGPEVGIRGTVGYAVSDSLNILVEPSGGVALATRTAGTRGNPFEIMAGARYQLMEKMALTAGIGTALFSAPGTGDLRLLGGVSYGSGVDTRETDSCTTIEKGVKSLHRVSRIDLDKDGVDDACDVCPSEAETKNGKDDFDGCPEIPPDQDKDSIIDSADECPTEPGIKPSGCPDSDGDGVLNRDDECPAIAGKTASGCPDADGDGLLDKNDECPQEAGKAPSGCPDSDGDGLLDKNDKCPQEPEDKDNFQDDDGCLDADNDADGIVDTSDACPLEKEDIDTFEDTDGCPELDNDKDGVPDASDKCPIEPETINGNEDEDGCPDKGKSLVILTADKIEILDKVYFATGKDVIEKKSFVLLKQVAMIVKGHAEIKHLNVEGHTDDKGDAAKNKDLSQRRAAAVVKFLTAEGVSADRLFPQGFGPEKPLVPNKTEKDRAQNRRVEFTIEHK